MVQTFTDKARIEEYIKEKHGDMIGVFPAIAGFYTNWGLLNALRCAVAVRCVRLMAVLVDRWRWIAWPAVQGKQGLPLSHRSPRRSIEWQSDQPLCTDFVQVAVQP